MLGPESGRIGRLLDEGCSPDDPELPRRIHKTFPVSRLDLPVPVVADMVINPGS